METSTVPPTVVASLARTWRDWYPVHPCADVFPMMTDEEIAALAEDIKAHGLQQRVVLWQAPQASKVRAKPAAYFVLDGRNRLEALVRLGVEIPSPDDPRGWVNLPCDLSGCVFEVANDRRHWHAPEVQDPAQFVIGANIRRRHLTKEQQAELIVRTMEADRNELANVARSFSPTAGKKGGSTKDAVLEKSVAEGKKHGISTRTMRRARATVQGKIPAPMKPKSQPATTTRTTTGEAVPVSTSSQTGAGSEQTTTIQREVVGDLLDALHRLKNKHGEAKVRRALGQVVSGGTWCLDQRVSA
jgi:hypothetical protein